MGYPVPKNYPIRRSWQYDDTTTDPQLTCYDDRHPAMPWIRAEQYEDASERMEACDMLADGLVVTKVANLPRRKSAEQDENPTGNGHYVAAAIERIARPKP